MLNNAQVPALGDIHWKRKKKEEKQDWNENYEYSFELVKFEILE